VFILFLVVFVLTVFNFYIKPSAKMSTTVIQAEVTPATSPIPTAGDIVTSMHSVNVEKVPENMAIVTPTPSHIKQPVPIQQNPAAAANVLAFPTLSAPVAAPMKVNMPPQATMVTSAPPCTNKKAKKSKSKSNQDKSSQGSQGENTGRWTAEEHRLFLQGLEEHGKGWKKIASLIKSRTVVQIRTHAQKYFQKLAKARHNGEEGDVSMEGRGVNVNIPAAPPVLSNPTQVVKRRRQVSGTKRKALADVVASAHKDAKKDNRLPVVSPVLAPFVTGGEDEQLADVSPSALEDSLYRFLTPSATNFMPVVTTPEPYPNSVSPTPQQNVENIGTGVSITLPSKAVLSGESSPTGVCDILTQPEVFQSEIPQWFAKGSDVDELLNEAEALDWLADPGDLVDNYIVPPQEAVVSNEVVSIEPTPVVAPPAPANVPATHETGVNEVVADPIQNATNIGNEALAPVVSYSSMSMNELPALFDTTDDQHPNKRLKLSSNNLYSATTGHEASTAVDAVETTTTEVEGFSVFDTSFDEQAFVSALLDSNDHTLSVLS